MKFKYPELETESHNGQRWYLTPNGAMPSITTIIGQTTPPEKVASLENWKNSLGIEKAAAVSKKAINHGTNVHLLAERHLKKEDVLAPINGQPVPEADRNAFNALKLKLNKIEEIWGQEVALYSNTIEVAGRCDLIGVFKGKPVIIDFKTSSRVKSRKDIADYALQLLFYGLSHNSMFDTSIETGVILMVAETGFPMEFTVKFTSSLELALLERVNTFYSQYYISITDYECKFKP